MPTWPKASVRRWPRRSHRSLWRPGGNVAGVPAPAPAETSRWTSYPRHHCERLICVGLLQCCNRLAVALTHLAPSATMACASTSLGEASARI